MLGKEAIIKNNKLSFDSKNLNLTYDFWADGGNMNVSIYNKTDRPIYINLDKSHLIVNGQSYDDYTKEETIKTNKNGASVYYSDSVSKETQSEITVKSKVKSIVEIPPQSFINIGNLSIFPLRYVDCDLEKYPFSKISSKTFDISNTPLKFRNYITIDFTETFEKPLVIDNSFWVEKR